jgi:hypothetical protein
MNKIQSLADYLQIDQSSIRTLYWDDCVFDTGDAEYLVLTDDEADTRLRAEIRDSVWAFNPNFIADHSSACSANRKAFAEIFKIAQEKLCEDANPLLLEIIDDFDEFADDAEASDGREHFLAQYDDKEIELGDGLYAYRVG